MSANKLVKERIDAITSILDKNGIKYNMQVANATSVAYDKEEYGIKAFKNVDLLEKLANYGVNHGFKSVKDDIKKLTDVIVNLSKINSDSKFEKLNKDVDNIMAKNNNIDASQGAIKLPLISLIENTIDGIDKIKDEKGNEEKKAMFAETNQALGEVVNRIKALSDNYSKVAYEYARKIFINVLEIRQKVAYGSLAASSAKKIIKNIEDDVLLWENQKNSQLKKAKIAEDYKFDPNMEDKFYISTNSAIFFEDFDMLTAEKDKLYSKMVDDSHVDELIEKQKAAFAKIDEINASAQELKAKYDAKRISKDEVAIRLKQLQFQKTHENDEADRIAKQLDKLGAKKYVTNKRIYDIVNEICMIVDENRENKEFIYLLSKHFDIDSVMSLVNGNPSAEDIVNVKESFKAAKIFADAQNANLKEAIKGVELLDDIFAEDEIEEEEEDRVKEKTAKRVTEQEVDDLFSSFGIENNNEAEKPQQDENQNEDIDINNFIK